MLWLKCANNDGLSARKRDIPGVVVNTFVCKQHRLGINADKNKAIVVKIKNKSVKIYARPLEVVNELGA